jgi:hypothetical protein
MTSKLGGEWGEDRVQGSPPEPSRPGLGLPFWVTLVFPRAKRDTNLAAVRIFKIMHRGMREKNNQLQGIKSSPIQMPYAIEVKSQ